MYLEEAKDAVKGFKDYERYGKLWTERFKGRRLRSIARDEVEAWKQRRRREIGRRGRQLGPGAVNRELAFLKHLYNLAIPKYADTNPVRGVKFFKEPHRVRYLTEDEEERLRPKLEGIRFGWAIVVLAMNSGGRRANVFRLRRDEVNFDAGVITFTETKTGAEAGAAEAPSGTEPLLPPPPPPQPAASRASPARIRTSENTAPMRYKAIDAGSLTGASGRSRFQIHSQAQSNPRRRRPAMRMLPPSSSGGRTRRGSRC